MGSRASVRLLLFTLTIALPGRAQGPPEADLAARLAEAAVARLDHSVTYDGSYRRIPYPNGDVPPHVGVCTDLVVRSCRSVGLDLQRAVHEDMTSDFAAYPNLWGLTEPDSNIDHRRVPNLRRYFERQGLSLPVTREPSAYRAGDIVAWRLPSGLPHVGILIGRRSADGERPLVVHNIGAGPELDDCLFRFEITGHYRLTGVR